MHDRPVPESAGTFGDDWKATFLENPEFRCRGCGSARVYYRVWTSLDEAHEDIKYRCQDCNRVWWCEGPDA